jgi:Effector protein
MAKPILMSYATWMSDTTVKKWHGQSDKDRSPDLANVDAYLQQYEISAQWPQMLRQLEVVLDKWVSAKTKPDGTLNTIRDNATVKLLVQQVKTARTFPNPVPWDPAFPGISIAQDPFAGDFPVPADFSTKVGNDLGDLISKVRGKQLMKMISDACEDKKHQVVVQYFTKGSSNCAPVNVPITNEFRRRLTEPGGVNMTELMGNPALVAMSIRVGSGGREFVPNTGANAVVRYDPDDKGSGEEAGRPSFIALAHEMVHAYHFVNGLCARQPTGGTSGDQGGAEEEMRAVGARAYKDDPPSENWIRDECSLPLRTSYSGNDFSGTTATLFK